MILHKEKGNGRSEFVGSRRTGTRIQGLNVVVTALESLLNLLSVKAGRGEVDSGKNGRNLTFEGRRRKGMKAKAKITPEKKAKNRKKTGKRCRT